MKLATKYHGEQEIAESDIVWFEDGLPGFGEEKKWVILPLTEDETFYVLQSALTPKLALILTNPFLTRPDYEFKLEDEAVQAIGATKGNIIVYSVVSVKEPFKESTLNLQAPIVMDLKSRRAKQVILSDADYEIRTPLFPKVESKGE